MVIAHPFLIADPIVIVDPVVSCILLFVVVLVPFPSEVRCASLWPWVSTFSCVLHVVSGVWL